MKKTAASLVLLFIMIHFSLVNSVAIADFLGTETMPLVMLALGTILLAIAKIVRRNKNKTGPTPLHRSTKALILNGERQDMP